MEDIKTLYQHDLASFFRFSFTELHPLETYMHNWHIDVMAHYLSQIEKGALRKLIINVPPRSLKSECASIAFPAWILGRNPGKKVLCLHGSHALGVDLHNSTQELMASKRYKYLFPSSAVKASHDQLRTSLKGKRQFASFDGRLAGLGADLIIIDDPISTEDAHSEAALERLNQQFDDNILQRLNNKKNGAIILVMQRLHENDLTAHLLAKNDGWEHVDISAIALRNEVWQLPYNQTYHRKKGEALQSERDSVTELQHILCAVGGHTFAYQYLQGQYKPHFGKQGYGSIFLTPFRENVEWDPCAENNGRYGFFNFTEADLILPKVFGVGDDPWPTNMRYQLSIEEWQKSANKHLQEFEESEAKRLKDLEKP